MSPKSLCGVKQMPMHEVPLLRESSAYVARLLDASRRFGETRYYFHRRVNWSYRYSTCFYQAESECFRMAPSDYLGGHQQIEPQLEDVMALRLNSKQVVNTLLKVAAHWLFYLVGHFADRGIRERGASVYRKAYVDDIELVFKPDQVGVVRAIYPFPINLGRQLRYVKFLRGRGYPFKLDGNPYSPKDLMRFLLRRDVCSLARLETRAQLRHAKEVVALGVKTIQLSDEFDIGSLDFCRMLARFPVRVVNSAHGVGKYLPVHAYQEFHVITERQAQYYHATHACRYSLNTLNVKDSTAAVQRTVASMSEINLVFLSQIFGGVGEVIVRNEARVVQRLATDFRGVSNIQLLYRPHPNSHKPIVPEGFKHLLRLEDVNGQPGTVYVSFFSTCQLDPNFKGRKLLLRGELIYPEISFDTSEEILSLDELVELLWCLNEQLSQ